MDIVSISKAFDSGVVQLSEFAVSVILLTYNHVKFIEQATRSILAQNLDQLPGGIEIIVGEDCSKDETPNILRRLDREFPGRMTLLLRPQNLGLSRNLEDCWQRCRGRYIAILEGDDFWTDPNKLAKVVKHLDEHPEQSGCWHACHMESTVSSVSSGFLPSPFPVAPIGVVELLEDNPLGSYSLTCYRRGLVPIFPAGHRRLACGDWLLNLMHVMHGPIGFLPELMATYRVHPKGMMYTLDLGRQIAEKFEVLFHFDHESHGQYHEQVAAAFARRQQRLSREMEGIQKMAVRYQAMHLDKVAACVKRLLSPFRSATS